MLAAALNTNGMLWKTSPAVTELEQVSLSWLRQWLALPPEWFGMIYDTASASSMHAIAAAREMIAPEARENGSPAGLVMYTSEQAHSSIEKGAIAVGIGQRNVRKIATDAEFRMRPDALEAAIARDLADGKRPFCVSATVGTTSTTSVDPVADIGAICTREHVWLHVDAAYGGAAAMLPSHAHVLDGAAAADSLVVNPHKWLFTPFDLSAFYCRRMDVLRQAFSLTPEYLRTTEAAPVKNLMDTGVQLGRRFRALKLWMVLRYFGAEGLRARLAEHIRLAHLFAEWVDADEDFERLAPVPFSVVCFRARPHRGGGTGDSPGDDWTESDLESLNQRLLDAMNATGEVFLSHTKLDGRFVLRLAVGNLRTEERHVNRAWEIAKRELTRVLGAKC
jgi:aromatic-L-amino-acid decarboxylase